MKILKIILIVAVVLVAIVCILGWVLPKTYTVQRQVSIIAPKQRTYKLISCFKKFDQWSPWNEYDPNMQKNYEGVDGQVGAKYSWKGNDQVGVGSQEITALSDNRIDLKLVFTSPWQSTSNVYFIVDEAENNTTKVTWGMEGENPFPMNVMAMFMSMDAMIGKDFEKGLNKLKTICESTPKYNGYEVKTVDMPEKNYIIKKQTVKFDDLNSFFTKTMTESFAMLSKAKIRLSGAPSALYFSWDTVSKTTQMTIAMPVAPGTKAPKGYETTTLPASKALTLAYYGSYQGSMSAHDGMGMYMAENKTEMLYPVIEEYVTNPSQEKDTTKWLTNIYYLVK